MLNQTWCIHYFGFFFPDLGPEVAHVSSYDPSTGILLGTACCVETYLLSKDLGMTWTPVSMTNFLHHKLNFRTNRPVEVPWRIDESTFSPAQKGIDCVQYTVGDWQCTFKISNEVTRFHEVSFYKLILYTYTKWIYFASPQAAEHVNLLTKVSFSGTFWKKSHGK